MQGLGLVRISKKQNLIETLFLKNSECKKLGLVPTLQPIYKSTLQPIYPSPRVDRSTHISDSIQIFKFGMRVHWINSWTHCFLFLKIVIFFQKKTVQQNLTLFWHDYGSLAPIFGPIFR